MNFLEKFSKTRHTILYKLFSAEGQREREGRTLFIEFYNFGTPLLTCCTSTEVLQNVLVFLQTLEPISHYCLSGQHIYTRGQLTDKDNLILECTNLKYYAEIQSF